MSLMAPDRFVNVHESLAPDAATAVLFDEGEALFPREFRNGGDLARGPFFFAIRWFVGQIASEGYTRVWSADRWREKTKGRAERGESVVEVKDKSAVMSSRRRRKGKRTGTGTGTRTGTEAQVGNEHEFSFHAPFVIPSPLMYSTKRPTVDYHIQTRSSLLLFCSLPCLCTLQSHPHTHAHINGPGMLTRTVLRSQ
ncbi:hypothetical protein BC939DRAFT_247224 [Gamsiella multidivaricata]|uniref:uncharacterized protein n=1 Tax=Gamsiella multidivaricata TaxID=101098 RepID=UPI00221F5E7A|nr:uncharacterized protein BC939DRAFT_247224 [Gamsiella multidivaricata]KAI7819770.1 hypothetical protein BC939DRAFT_247224 [Gamsiella multidivaricata]